MGRRRASTRVLEPAADNRVACHGRKGDGKPNDPLGGGSDTLTGDKPVIETVGSYSP
jgi:cytochrome c